MTINNQTLTLEINHESCGAVLQKIGSLGKLFLTHFKRSPECELVYSLTGDKKNPCHSLAVWHDGSAEQMREIEFFKKNL